MKKKSLVGYVEKFVWFHQFYQGGDTKKFPHTRNHPKIGYTKVRITIEEIK